MPCGSLAWAFATAAALEWRSERSAAVRRAVLLALTGALAVARLDGALPVSGHAVFLAAALGFELCAKAEARRLRLGLCAAGLAVTGAYKLFAWGDAAWFAASVGIGAAMGVASSGAHSPSRGDPQNNIAKHTS